MSENVQYPQFGDMMITRGKRLEHEIAVDDDAFAEDHLLHHLWIGSLFNQNTAQGQNVSLSPIILLLKKY